MKSLLRNKNQAGITLIEIIVSISILAIIALALESNILTTVRNHKTIQVISALNNLAIGKLEEYGAVNPQDMDSSSHDSTETGLTVSYLSGFTFTRVTDVTQNADDTRTVIVTVTSNHPAYVRSVTLDTVYVRW